MGKGDFGPEPVPHVSPVAWTVDLESQWCPLRGKGGCRPDRLLLYSLVLIRSL